MNDNYKNIKIISFAILSCIALIVIISVVRTITFAKPVDLYNIDQIDSGLTNQEISELEDYIWQNLKTNQLYLNDTGIKVLIRNGSFSKTIEYNIAFYNFLIDIDEFKATYDVSFTIAGDNGFYEAPTITCPLLSQMKYPETGCRGQKSATATTSFRPNLLQSNNLAKKG